MHGKLNIHEGKLEVKCGRRGCGAGRGIVVLHTFDITTGELVGTKQFADPAKKEELSYGTR
jgi:hypothetical protein